MKRSTGSNSGLLTKVKSAPCPCKMCTKEYGKRWFRRRSKVAMRRTDRIAIDEWVCAEQEMCG
jgi:hypothetical protein